VLLLVLLVCRSPWASSSSSATSIIIDPTSRAAPLQAGLSDRQS
jgi:hypothetical protein